MFLLLEVGLLENSFEKYNFKHRLFSHHVLVFACFATIFFVIATSFSTVCADEVDNEAPSTNSRRCVIYDRTSNTVIYGKNENVKGAMASTTKIMTATIVLENADLSEVVEVSAKAGGTGGSRLGLKCNDKITVNDLLYGLMLRSGNDAAVALAEYVSGSVEDFAQLMNEKALDLGLTSTHFVTPHGLDNSEHYTTAYELAVITDYALQNEKFAEIVAKTSATIYINNNPMTISNTNELLGNLNGVIGVKTGFTNNAGRCLVTETKRGDMDIIVVVLGADTKNYRTQDSIELIEYAFSNYKMVDIKTKILEEFSNWKNINAGRIEIIKGNASSLELTLGVLELETLPLKDSDVDKLQYEINALTLFEAPVERWAKVGTLIVKLDDKIIESIDIINTCPVGKKTWLDYFKETLELTKNILHFLG